MSTSINEIKKKWRDQNKEHISAYNKEYFQRKKKKIYAKRKSRRNTPSLIRKISKISKKPKSLMQSLSILLSETKYSVKPIGKSSLRCVFRNTKPEIIMQKSLLLNGIGFETHKVISKENFRHDVDIFIEPNICIEVDGKFWHTRPKAIRRDSIVNHELNCMGYVVLRFWDVDVFDDVQKCTKIILKMINSQVI